MFSFCLFDCPLDSRILEGSAILLRFLVSECSHISLSGDSEVQRTMLELLNQLDGFEATKNIKVYVYDAMHFLVPTLILSNYYIQRLGLQS